MKAVLQYTMAPGGMAKVRDVFPAHRARWQQFVADGSLLAIGPFADPAQGALAIFRDRPAAEAFAASDPFVLQGVVGSWRVLDWNEALLP